ncbi:MAG: DUF2961 domain-containing protein [Planctomycetes bacterium]|nr:DUF2961 domain-containing protein [Planctomycetota bacterium]
MRNIAVFFIFTFGILFIAQAAPADEITGYETLINWASLPSAKTGMTSHMASSYDRSGANEDWNWYPGYDRQLNALTDNETTVTLLDVQGSGVLTRYWMPHATANGGRAVTITVDGVAMVVTDTNTLLGGSYATDDTNLFKSPLVQTVAGGQMSYEPIGFSTSLKVEWTNLAHTSQPGMTSYTRRGYYQLNYQLHSNDSVASYTGSLTDQQSSARQQAAAVISNVGANPAGESLSSTKLNTAAQSIAAGQSISLASMGSGQSGVIRKLNLKMDDPSDAALANLRIRINYGAQSEFAVDVPIGAFFGAASSSAQQYKSLPMGTDSTDGYYCYFPIPYRDGVTVEIYNAGQEDFAIGGGIVEYEAGPVADDMGYFHAGYNVSNPGSATHNMLSVSGKGHYVGNILTIKAPESDADGLKSNILEGDERILVDGERVLHGTGLEDAYNGGFYYNHVLKQDDDGDPAYPATDVGAFGGLLLMDTLKDRESGEPDILSGILQASQCRWMLQDLVAFDTGLNVSIENYGGQSAIYESTSFYYLVPEPATIATFLAAGFVSLCRRRRQCR